LEWNLLREQSMKLWPPLTLLITLAGCATAPKSSIVVPDGAEAQGAKAECDLNYSKCQRLRGDKDTYCSHARDRCYRGIPGSSG
jgi:hypothetical protein